MTKIKGVVCGWRYDPSSSDEFGLGWDNIRRLLPPETPVHFVEHAESIVGVGEAALAWMGGDEGRLLLLAHPHLLITRRTIETLEEALDPCGAGLVCAFDARLPYPQHEPDYCTFRGLERYQNKLASLPALVGATLNGLPLAALVDTKTLRKGPLDWGRAFWVGDAYVHDFSDYHQGRREEVIGSVPDYAQRVLDVGGGEGGFLAALKEARGCETHLAEFSAEACNKARAKVDRVWEGDFARMDFSGELFDCITFLDVLEHTEWPEKWLAKAAALLRPNGVVVVSIPNVGHWSVIADLLEGRWDYCPVGIHCITHLRFFTRHSVTALLAQAGLEVECIKTTEVGTPHWFVVPEMSGLRAANPADLNAYAFIATARIAAHSVQ
jgi:2-polyprenyl-3-methyl-5-hydroxy-6-metoxy-1,4-benzoquinol methylase